MNRDGGGDSDDCGENRMYCGSLWENWENEVESQWDDLGQKEKEGKRYREPRVNEEGEGVQRANWTSWVKGMKWAIEKREDLKICGFWVRTDERAWESLVQTDPFSFSLGWLALQAIRRI